MFPQIFRLQAQINVKLTKSTVPGTHFIKAHLVDNLFHRGHLFRHQGYAPFPIIEARTGGDDWEWGVTLFGVKMDDLKDTVYTMRYDTASALFADFGPFYAGMVGPVDEIMARTA